MKKNSNYVRTLAAVQIKSPLPSTSGHPTPVSWGGGEWVIASHPCNNLFSFGVASNGSPSASIPFRRRLHWRCRGARKFLCQLVFVHGGFVFVVASWRGSMGAVSDDFVFHNLLFRAFANKIIGLVLAMLARLSA